MLTYWAVENLHRLPEEIHLPEHTVRRAMRACAHIRQRIAEENS